MTSTAARADDDELELLLEEVVQLEHQDFRGYARSSLRRCVTRAQERQGGVTLAALRARVRVDADARAMLVDCLTTTVSELFRDPPYFCALREQGIPHLATWPSIRVWVAGCGAGEEAWSIAILLAEAGLLDRARIYGTDIDGEALRVAERARYPATRLGSLQERYRAAGGSDGLSKHLHERDGQLVLDGALRARVSFAEHSLATDAAFAEVQLVSCRNVLIYFGAALRERTLGMFQDALCPGGLLGLGAQETLGPVGAAPRFVPFAEAARLYRRP